MRHPTIRDLVVEVEHRHRPAYETGEALTDYLGCLYAHVDLALSYGQIQKYGHRDAGHRRPPTAAQQATGFTVVRLRDDSGQVLSVGIAFCTGNFNRKLGVKIALGRATKFLSTGGVNLTALESRLA